MTARSTLRTAALMMLVTAVVTGCVRRAGPLQPVPPITDPIVFVDAFPPGTDFQAFLYSKLDAVSVDATESFQGSASLKITVPGPSDPSGGYAGGAFTASLARDFSGYDALTFWAKANMNASLDVVGLGNDNTGTSRYEASWSNIQLTRDWTKYAIPIPLPSKLTKERGLFFFADSSKASGGYTIWFDEVRFERLGTITDPRPIMTSQTVRTFVGGTVTIQGTRTVFKVDGVDRTIQHFPSYFTFASSDEAVATVTNNTVLAVGGGTASITGKLGDVDALGSVTIISTAPPTIPAPTPTLPAADVISLFSNAYANVPVDTWSATWDIADLNDFTIGGNDTKAYTNVSYAGIEFATHTIDATAMTHFHIDVWIPSGSLFKIKLVDFGDDGAYGGGDDREQELTFTSATTPPITTGAWVGLDVPLADFNNLPARAHLAQLILSGSPAFFVDNVYFHK